jgi:hypothetical protein
VLFWQGASFAAAASPSRGPSIQFRHIYALTASRSHALEDDLAMALLAMENTPEVVKSIAAWPWIIDALTIWK